ncbi:hypothetical protein CISIN_1g040044mg [Citrus sinensis]|uniref:TTF-type domain-containing protein n=1 Tax=Citrus sinensis TaxID=2711 RepID=A0A067ED26_CITSI|nr:hypothetical protein CISIN_1g040044mg [Citrus sinensis]
MEKILKKKPQLPSPLEGTSDGSYEVNLKNLLDDRGLRPCIDSYNCNIRDQVRRTYLQREFGSWLEYNTKEESAYCLFCYLFKEDNGDQAGSDTFTRKEFKTWKKKEKLNIHEGGVNSGHNRIRQKCERLMNQKQHIVTFFARQSEKTQSEYKTRLNANVDCIRFLLNQGVAFRGHDEFDGSSNRGNFLELLRFFVDHNEDINVVTFRNTPLNLQMTSPKIQKDIVSCSATETTNVIIREMDFCIEHVSSTTAASLKESLNNIFSRFGLSLSMLHRQGYDGASNMQGEFNGLKTLILEENESAYYAKKHEEINSLFNLISMLVNVVGVSVKRRDILHEKHALAVIEALGKSKISSGQGLNQEITLKHLIDTRWSSHYALQRKDQYILNVVKLVEVYKHNLQKLRDNGWDSLFGQDSTFYSKHDIDVLDMNDLFLIPG